MPVIGGGFFGKRNTRTAGVFFVRQGPARPPFSPSSAPPHHLRHCLRTTSATASALPPSPPSHCLCGEKNVKNASETKLCIFSKMISILYKKCDFKHTGAP